MSLFAVKISIKILINDNIESLPKLSWYNISEYGYINNNNIKYKPAIYIYKKDNLNKDPQFYIGSSINLAARISSHRCYIHNWNKYKNTDRGSSIFYKSIHKYGWSSFKFSILEYINESDYNNLEEKREIILRKEQYYLDTISPSLNICRKANIPLGFKRDAQFSLNLSKSRRGISIRCSKNYNKIIRSNSPETRLKISLYNKGIIVKIKDKKGNILQEFPSIRKAAAYLNVDPKTINNIYKTRRSYDNFIYDFKIKYDKIRIHNKNYELINTLDSAKKTSILYDIPESTLCNYIQSGKIYKNKYYFSRI